MDSASAANSILGTLLQAVGITLIAVLSFFLARSVRREYFQYWSAAWVCLSISLSALYVSFRLPVHRSALEALYFLGEYAFGYLFVAGSRNFATRRLLARSDLAALGPALALALILPRVGADFSGRFVPHSLLVAALFAVSVTYLARVRSSPLIGPGLSIVRIALVLLVADFLHYAPVLTFAQREGVVLPMEYRAATSLYDLLLEILLAFGTIVLVMEDINRDLQTAHDRLEQLARVDPLTQALNRHALHSLLEEDRSASPAGCVAVVDIDNLKPLNDSLGHAAGDMAIRAVAGAVRALVRADDLVFRWGGDEFLVLLYGVGAEEGERRLDGLNEALRAVKVPAAAEPVRLRVSVGVAAFSAALPLPAAIEEADRRMYARKQAARGGG